MHHRIEEAILQQKFRGRETEKPQASASRPPGRPALSQVEGASQKALQQLPYRRRRLMAESCPSARELAPGLRKIPFHWRTINE